MASIRLTGLSYSTTHGARVTQGFFRRVPLCPWRPSWFATAWTAAGDLPSLIEEEKEREEAMLQKKDPSGAPQNSSLPPMIAPAAPGGPSTQAEQAAEPLTTPVNQPPSSEPVNDAAAAPPIRRWRLRFLVEIIKKHEHKE